MLVFRQRAQFIVPRPLKIHEPTAQTDETKRQNNGQNNQAAPVFCGFHNSLKFRLPPGADRFLSDGVTGRRQII